MTPSSAADLGVEPREIRIPMTRLSTKNSPASTAVVLVRKLLAPRAPNTVADAPPPKPEPACAPAPRWTRMNPIIEAAISTYTTFNMFRVIACSLSRRRRAADRQELLGLEGGPADQPAVH